MQEEKISIAPSTLFSYWVFAWALFYLVVHGMVSHFPKWKSSFSQWFLRMGNPWYALWIALIQNILFLIWWVYQRRLDVLIFSLFIIIIFIIKVIPLFYLRNVPRHPIPNVIFALVLFAIYNLYLFAKGTNVWEIYENAVAVIQQGKSPFIAYVKTHMNTYGNGNENGNGNG